MTLKERVFPSTEPLDRIVARSKFVGSWESQLRGLGRHTAYMSADLTEFRADIDDVAMDIVFLQRHRVEVGLKLLLERAGAEVPKTHDISDLWRRCLDALRASDHSAFADKLQAEAREFVDVMHAADPGSYAYRYPVDNENQPAHREQYIDLRELEVAGADFQVSVVSTVAALTEEIPVPVTEDEVDATVAEAASVIRTMRTLVAFIEAVEAVMLDDLVRAGTVAGRAGLSPSAESARGLERGQEWLVALRTIAPPLEVLLLRLASRRAPDAAAPSLDADVIPTMPVWTPAALLAPAEHAQKRMHELVDGMVLYFPPVKSALAKMMARTATWPSEADRQLHLDLERLHSRILVGVDPDAIPSQGGEGA
jgi:hypothetical protein